MTVAQFWQRYLADNGYRTPPERRRAALGRLNVAYTTWLLASIWRTSRVFKRQTPMSPELWGPRSFAVHSIIEACGGRIEVEGVANLRKIDGPVVYVSNHMSMAETLLLPSYLLPFGLFTWVVKESLLRYPAFGTIMQALDPIAVSRRDPREDLKQVMREGVEVLGPQKRSLVIFPQATRSVVFRPRLFNTLGVKLARKAGVSVVPIALKTDFQGVGRLIRDFGPVDRGKTLHFRFGAPRTVTGTGRDAHQATIDFIATSLREWGGEVEAGDAGRQR